MSCFQRQDQVQRRLHGRSAQRRRRPARGWCLLGYGLRRGQPRHGRAGRLPQRRGAHQLLGAAGLQHDIEGPMGGEPSYPCLVDNCFPTAMHVCRNLSSVGYAFAIRQSQVVLSRIATFVRNWIRCSGAARTFTLCHVPPIESTFWTYGMFVSSPWKLVLERLDTSYRSCARSPLCCQTQPAVS